MRISEPRVGDSYVAPSMTPSRDVTALPAERDCRRIALLDIIARAAAPFERSSLPCFGVPDGASAERSAVQREDDWMRMVTRGDAEAFVELLATRGLDRADARRGLTDVMVVDETTLPPWAHDVLSLFSGEVLAGAHDASAEPVPTFALGELSDRHALALMAADPAAPWALHRVFEPLVQHGARYLGTRVARSAVPIGPAAQRQLLAALAQRISGPCTPLLFHRLTVADTIVDHPGVAGQTAQTAFFGDALPVLDQWLRLCRIYPVLARLIAVAYRNWCDTTAELIARIDHDRARLESTFATGPLGALTGCAVGMGDSHDHGRTVAIVTFESGARIVYKPKDLRVASAYMHLVHRLNADGVTPALPTRRIVEGDGYGWEEFVGEEGCVSVGDVRRFYLQLGMHARLVQLLDGLDFTGDNVIAAGDHPALVDLEALLTPRIPVRGPGPVHDEALARAFESPARGCLITAKILGERGRPAAELGALAPSVACVSPFKQRVVRSTDAGPALVDAYPEFPAFRATPSCDGVRVNSIEYFDSVVAGYVTMGEHLRRVHPVLADAAGPLAPLHDVQVRCLCRDTHVYARMLQASLTPARLRDGVERELCLERMWKARFSSPAVAAAEIQALRDLDIPMFASRAGSTELLQEGVVLVDDFFLGTAAERLAERVAALPSSTRAHDRELIESVLFTLAPGARRRTGATARGPRAGARDWLSAAERVGDEMIAACIGATEQPKWIGGSCHPGNGCWVFSVLGDDVYSGMAGIGLVLAELAAATGSPRVRTAASATLHGVSRRLGGVHAQSIADPVAHPPGAMFGWGGRLYACDRGSRLLTDDSLRHGGAHLVHTLAALGEARLADVIVRARAWDLATGVAGLLLVALATETGTDAERATIATVAGRLLSAHCSGSETDPPLYPPGADPRGIVGGQTGARLALARWHARSGAPPGEPPCDGGECDTAELTAGDVIGLLAIASERTGMRAAALRAAALRTADVYLRVPVADADGLRWLERGEVALAAHAVRADPGYRATAEDAGERLDTLKRRTGRWLPERLLADRYNPSAVVGLGAVAHFFLHLASPGPLPSYRVVA